MKTTVIGAHPKISDEHQDLRRALHRHDRGERNDDDGDLHAPQREQPRRRPAPLQLTLVHLGHCAAQYRGVRLPPRHGLRQPKAKEP